MTLETSSTSQLIVSKCSMTISVISSSSSQVMPESFDLVVMHIKLKSQYTSFILRTLKPSACSTTFQSSGTSSSPLTTTFIFFIPPPSSVSRDPHPIVARHHLALLVCLICFIRFSPFFRLSCPSPYV